MNSTRALAGFLLLLGSGFLIFAPPAWKPIAWLGFGVFLEMALLV
jgi:hypothetical protein